MFLQRVQMILFLTTLLLGNFMFAHAYEQYKFLPPSSIASKAHIGNFDEYLTEYQKSVSDPDAYWLEKSATLQWNKKPTIACDWKWESVHSLIEHAWFPDGELNVSENCLDRHIMTDRKHKKAIIWQGD